MKILKIIGIVLGVALLVLLAIGFMAPKSYKVERSTVISVTDTVAYNYLIDWKSESEWSPWLEMDTNAKVTYSENSNAVGSTYSWEGNEDLGSGIQTRLAQTPYSEIKSQLKFTAPWENEALTDFIISPESQGTKVTWTLTGDMGFIESIMVMMGGGMSEFVGPDYERGLKKLKENLENR